MIEQTSEIPQPIQPVQSVPLEPKKKSNLPTIVILLIAILLIAGGVVFGMQLGKKQATDGTPQSGKLPKETPQVFIETITLKPTETVDETVNWKIYTGNGFSFKYPQDWLSSSNKVQSPDYKADHGLLAGGDFYIDSDPVQGQTLENVVVQTKQYNPNATTTSIKFLNYDAVSVSIPPEQEMGQYWPSRTIYFIKDDRLFHITMETYGSKMNDYLVQLDQILSTFKFTN